MTRNDLCWLAVGVVMAAAFMALAWHAPRKPPVPTGDDLDREWREMAGRL